MASLGHLAVGVAAGRWFSSTQAAQSWNVQTQGRVGMAFWMIYFSAMSFLPDGDVIGFSYGIRYWEPWGHRGASHSFVFAGGLALFCALLAWLSRKPSWALGILTFLVVISHGLLDTLTNGGLGVGLLWPFSYERFFAPWRPIPVSPIGRGFFSSYGMRVAFTEIVYFFVFFLYAFVPRRTSSPPRS